MRSTSDMGMPSRAEEITKLVNTRVVDSLSDSTIVGSGGVDMSDLDEKIKEILWQYGYSDKVKDYNSEIYRKFYPDALKEIKQVFIDDGWMKMTIPNHAEGDQVNVVCDGYMTGQEWFDKFESILTSFPCDQEYKEGEVTIRTHSMQQVRTAAMLAAGIE